MLTPEEAAEELRVGRDRVYQLMKTGELPSVKLGASRRIRAADLDQFVKSLPAEPVGTP